MTTDLQQTERASVETRRVHGALEYAVVSVCIPGVGQLLQVRWLTGVVQFGVVLAYLLGLFAVGAQHAIWWAVLWNLYSAAEAYWYARD